MNIFLTGGGDSHHFKELDKAFVDELPDKARLLVLPLACDEEDFEEIREGVEDHFFSRKIQSVDMIEHVGAISLENFLSYDGLYIEGGNTFQLIQQTRESMVFEYLKEFFKQNKVVYADSAGAIVLGRDVHSAFIGDDSDEDHLKLQDLRGLGLLGRWSVHCHYQPADLEALQDLIFETGNPFLALPEPIGIQVHESQVRVYGRGAMDVVDFTGRHSYPTGQVFDMDFESQ